VAGLVTENAIVNPDARLTDAGVNVVIDHVTEINREAKKVFVASGKSFEYDKLIFGLGSRPTMSPIPGKDLDGVFMLRRSESLSK